MKGGEKELLEFTKATSTKEEVKKKSLLGVSGPKEEAITETGQTYRKYSKKKDSLNFNKQNLKWNFLRVLKKYFGYFIKYFSEKTNADYSVSEDEFIRMVQVTNTMSIIKESFIEILETGKARRINLEGSIHKSIVSMINELNQLLKLKSFRDDLILKKIVIKINMCVLKFKQLRHDINKQFKLTTKAEKKNKEKVIEVEDMTVPEVTQKKKPETVLVEVIEEDNQYEKEIESQSEETVFLTREDLLLFSLN